MAQRTPIVAIVGRPNVGKSTLFNRVIGSRRAVVEDFPGVTRDRNYALVERFEVPFYLVDTGGFEKDPQDELQQFVVVQAVVAATEADLIIALFDGKTGFSVGDQEVVELLRRYKKPVVYVANKCDGQEQGVQVADFYRLGLDEISFFSALHGRGVNDVIRLALKKLPNYQSLVASAEMKREREETVVKELEERAEELALISEDVDGEERTTQRETLNQAKTPLDDGSVAVEYPDFAPVFTPETSPITEEGYFREHKLLPIAESVSIDDRSEGDRDHEQSSANLEKPDLPCIRVAIIGRPNVGKSTLLNMLTGEQRAVTSSVAGTTIDAIDLKIRRDGQDYLLIDTAGLRKKARVSDKVERYSTLRALTAIGECDIAAVLLDASTGPTEQDAKIIGLAHEQGKSIVLVVNKWDLVEKDHRSVQQFKEKIQQAFKFSPYAPILFVSAKTGKRCPKIISTIKEIAYERAKMVPTNRLNRVLERAQRKQNPTYYRGNQVRLCYGAQVDTAPPRFLLFFNFPHAVHFSYLRFIKNAIREEFGFHGTDIKLVTRKKN